MRPTNLRPKSNSAFSYNTRIMQVPSARLFLRVGAILIFAGVLASGFYWSSAAATSNKPFINHRPAVGRDEITAPVAAAGLSAMASLGVGNYSSLFTLPQSPSPVTITTYASDCTTPKSVFNLQDADKIVCAKVTGTQPTWRIIWSNANAVAVQNVPVGSGTSTFTLTSTSSLGDWRVILFEPFGGSVQQVTSFTVIDALNPQVDLSISKNGASGSVSAGAQVVFSLQATNGGPSDAAAVQLTDGVPANTTFVSFTQLDGPVFSCSNPLSGDTGTTVCTIASLGRGETAVFLGTYLVDSGVTAGDSISNTATVANTVSDTNADNNSSTAFVQVANSPCVLTCPANITVAADSGQTGAVVNYADPSSTGDCGQPFNSNPASGSFFPVGTSTVIATSQTGGVCTFQVTVENPGGLAISVNGANPLALECGTDFADPGATAVNGIGDPVPVEVSGTVENHTPGSYTLTYTATEGANSVSTSRTVNVSDNEAPVITIAGSNPMTVISGQTFVDPGASASDACEGIRPVNSSGTVDSNTPGTYLITYTASDSQNFTATATRTVIVEGDGTAPPTITLNGDAQMTIECGTTFTDPGATATASGGGPPDQFTTDNPVDSDTPGTYTVTYTACMFDSPDHCDPNQTSTAERTVTVEDTAAPTIEVQGANPMTVECHTSFTDPGAIAHDACAGDFAASAVGAVDANTVGQYIVTYSATDPSGNAATSVTRVVNVVDTTPPVVTAPGPVTVFTGAGAASCDATIDDATLGAASANDACDGSVATSRSGVPAGNIFPVGQTTVTYSATDANNNTGTASQTVTVVDNTPPVITLNGANPMTVECHTSFTDPGATANDACTGSVAVAATNNVNVNVPGSYAVIYTATDGAGNSASTTRTVNVVDTTPPTTAFNNLTIFLPNSTIVFNTNTVTVNGTTYPFNGVSATHNGYTFSFNGEAITVTHNGQSVTYTLEGKTLVLWIPFHQYEVVNVNDLIESAGDGCDSGVSRNNVVITQVTSDEAQNTAGSDDGNTVNDIVIAPDCKSVQLRAERANSGNGRVYTITMRVTDAAGNAQSVTSKIKVRRYPGQAAVDSGSQYTVTGNCP